MKKFLLLCIMAGTMTLAAVPVNAQTVYYVQSAKAKIMSGLSFKSAVIAEVPRGTKLISTGKEGNWVRVTYEDRQGYVPSLLLSNHRPMEKTGVIKAEGAEIKQGVRRRASSFTSAAAARGLSQDDRRRLSKEGKVDYKALEKMESFSVSPAEVDTFMEEKQ